MNSEDCGSLHCICLNLSLRLSLGQHNFEFRSVSRFYGKCGGAGLISISHFTTILEGINVEKSKLRWGRFHLAFKNRWEMWNGCYFRVTNMREAAFSFHGPVNLGEEGGHRSKLKVVLALNWK